MNNFRKILINQLANESSYVSDYGELEKLSGSFRTSRSLLLHMTVKR